MSTPASGIEPPFSDYLRELRRNWKIVAITTLVLSALALGLSLAQDKVYTATADVLIKKAPGRANLIGESPPELSTELILASSPSVRDVAEARLGFGTTATVRRIGDTTIIRITTEAATPALATKAADAYGEAFIEVRSRQATASLEATRKELETKLAEVNGPPGETELDASQIEEVAALADSVRTAVHQQNPDNLRAAITALGRLAGVSDPTNSNQLIRGAALQLLIDEIDAAERLANNSAPELVGPAEASTSPIRPAPLRNAVVGAALGLMLSIGGLLVRSYLDRRVHDAAGLHAATGVPVLGVLAGPPGGASRSRRGNSQAGAIGLQEVRAALQLRGVPEAVGAVQLTSPRRFDSLAELSVELGAAFTRADLSVIVVDADLRAGRRTLVPAGSGGLSSSGATDVDALLAAASVANGVRVIPAGEMSGDPAGFLGSRRFRDLVADLRMRADLVLVVAPPVLESPDPLLIGRVVTATVLVANPGTTRASDAAEAVERLREANQTVLGAILGSARGSLPPTATGGLRAVDDGPAGNGESARTQTLAPEASPSRPGHG